jgi:hypothetical protein
MGILSSAWTYVIWVWDYGIPSLFPVFGMAMIVPRRTDLPLLVPLAIIVPGQAWPSEGTYSGYCLGAAVALITVAYAVTTARVLTARHAPRLLPHRVAPRPRSGD